jgi:hypothetical protein
MSYLERLQNLKSGLDAQNQQFQSEQDNFTRDAENMRQVAMAKVEDYARNLEQAGGIGFGAIKAGQSVGKLYKKWRGKKEEPEEEEEPEEPEEEQMPETEEPQMVENPEIFDADGNLDLSPEGLARPQMIQATPEAEEPTGNEEVSTEQGPEENMEEEGPELTGEGETVADTSHLPSEMEMNDASNVGQRQGTTATQQDADTVQSTPDAQQATLDADPESTMNMNDASSSLADGTGADIGEATGDAIADATAGGSSALIDGLAVAGDVILDAIPVVGEFAMIGTAIAGFFEGIFGEHNAPPPPPAPAIVSKVGQDASALVSKAPEAVSGLV